MADDMGLGKTVQALCAVSYAHAQAPDRQSLVVCPASVMRNMLLLLLSSSLLLLLLLSLLLLLLLLVIL